MAKLILSMDELFLQEIPLNRERLTIGRKPHNDICLEFPTVSGDHAAIVTILDDSFLEDLGSTNGTRVNGAAISKHHLDDGDRIDIGRLHFQYCKHDQPVADTAGSGESSVPALLRVLSGTAAGRELPLIKRVTTLGRVGVQIAEVSRHGNNFVLQPREGERLPLVNGRTIDQQPMPLVAGDIVDIAGVRMELVITA